jgi:hypothetical protein
MYRATRTISGCSPIVLMEGMEHECREEQAIKCGEDVRFMDDLVLAPSITIDEHGLIIIDHLNGSIVYRTEEI